MVGPGPRYGFSAPGSRLGRGAATRLTPPPATTHSDPANHDTPLTNGLPIGTHRQARPSQASLPPRPCSSLASSLAHAARRAHRSIEAQLGFYALRHLPGTPSQPLLGTQPSPPYWKFTLRSASVIWDLE